MVDIQQIRNDFPILRGSVYGRPLVYLDNAATTHKPLPVLHSVQGFYSRTNSNIHRGIHYLSEQASQAYENARQRVQGFINARSVNEIVFTRGTTEAINLVAHCFGARHVGAGDEILISEMEHHSNLVPWQMLCERCGARLRVMPFSDKGVLDTDTISRLICTRTKLIALCFVSNVLGTINPVKQIVSLAHAHGVPVLVDGAQAVQHMPIDVQELDCDFLAFSGHKMYAETGIGVLYGRERLLEEMPPYQYGGGMIASVDFAQTRFAPLPFKFESGTPHIGGAISLDAAIGYLETIGTETLSEHDRALCDYALQAFGELENITIYGPQSGHCGCISFSLDRAASSDVALILDKLGIAVRSGNHCAQPVMKHFGVEGMVRASFALYTTTGEIDALVEGLERVRRIVG